MTSWLHYKKIHEILKLSQGQLNKLINLTREIILQLKHKSNSLLTDHPQLGGGIVIFLIGLMICLTVVVRNFAPVDYGNQARQPFVIDYGASLREVGNQLKAKGLVRSRMVYEIYVRLNPGKRMVKAGRYLIGSGMSLREIAADLHRGISPELQVTITEGLTKKEIAQLLDSKGLVDQQRFLELLADQQFIQELLGDLGLEGFTEGYLYPDTYRFTLDAGEEAVIRTMVKRFRKICQEQLGELSASELRRVLIMASIVEKEAQKASERSIIAGVFYNRIKKGYPLQSCATIQYALGTRKSRLLYQDLQVDSPYNTYKNYGLPPGPISNPGRASLKAAAYPEAVSYLYFVARSDGSHIFSNTYAQHLAAQRKAGL